MKSKKNVTSDGSEHTRGPRRFFSESARRAIVVEIEQGMSKAEASRRYGVSEASLYKWLEKYSVHYKKSLTTVVEHASDSDKVKRLEKELQSAYASLGRKDIELVYLESVLSQAGSHFGVDLKKSFGLRP